MKKLMTRKPGATSTKPENPSATESNAPTQKPLVSTTTPPSTTTQPNAADVLQTKLKEIQKKTANKFTIEEIQREYELAGNDEKKTLINLLKQKEEEEAAAKRNLFKRMEEATAAKAAINITFKPNPKSHLLEILEVIYVNTSVAESSKIMTVYHSKLKEVQENFSKPSPDQLIHISRND